MLIDLEQAPADTRYTSQVCVLGAGIAGLVLAQALAQRGFTVHLLEAGGLEPEARSQSLYAAGMAGDRHTGASEGRFRVFGGSSTRWGGQLLPYTEDVFSPVAGMPSRGWPIGADAIEPYYADVLKIMGADALPFDAGLLPALGHAEAGFGERVRLRFSKWAPFGRRNLAQTLGRQCIAHANVTVFAHANVMAVEFDEGGERAQLVRVVNYAGAAFEFSAEQICVCMGTIESARLLLASGHGGQGAADAKDAVGRYFHDHVSVRAAEIVGETRQRVLDRLGPFVVKDTLHTCKMEASPALRAGEALPAVMAHVVIEEPEGSGVAAVRGLLQAVQRGRIRQALAANLVPMLRGLGDVVRLVWASRVHGRRAVSAGAKVWLHIDMEQVAGANDRICLGEQSDAIGQRVAIVAWRTGDAERATARRYAQVMQSELAASGMGEVQWLPGLLDGDASCMTMTDTFHPMGGLRMGDDPVESVVDRDLKVHGVENLWVASCAVFPSGGSSNPTFTMMALTLRLADRLAALVQTG